MAPGPLLGLLPIGDQLMKTPSLAALSLLALVACNRSGTDDDSAMDANSAIMAEANSSAAVAPLPAPGEVSVVTDPALYVAQAAASDLFEIESSRAILQKTKNADVRRFAQMMIDNHQASTAKIKAASAKDTVTLSPAALQPDQDRMMDDIRSANANAADRAYAEHQRTAHTAALALHQGFAQGQGYTALRGVAAETARTVQKHMEELDRLEASLAGGR